MVGQHNAVDAEVDDRLRVLERLNSLDHQLVRPLRLDPRQVVERHGGVEHGVQVFGDRAGPPVQRRERQRFGGQQVEPPARVRHRVEHGAQRQRRRYGHAVAGVAQPRAGDRNVDGDQQRVVARRGGALHQRHRPVAVLPHVQLKPVAAMWVCGLDVLDRGGAQRRQRERDAGACGGVGAGDLALGVHQPGEARRRDAERQRDPVAEHGRSRCRPSRHRAGSSGETRCRGTPAGRGPATALPRPHRRCSRTPLSVCGAWRFGAGRRW